jgi:hypothetical protein
MALLRIWRNGDVVGPDKLAVQEDNWSTWNLGRTKKLARRVIEDGLVLKGEWECASVDLRKRVCVHELEEGRSRIGAKDVNFVASALIEPGLSGSQRRTDAERGWVFLSQMDSESKVAYLDPVPDSGEEGWCVYDGDCMESFWIVGGGQFGGLLEVAT